MSVRIERYDDVIRLRMRSFGARAVGLDVSAYLLRGILIDTGFHRARGALETAISEIGVRAAVVTHWHEDHAGNVELLARRGVPLFLRVDTASILRRRPPIRLYRRVVWGHPPPLRFAVRAYALDELAVIHTPGHSTDHQVVWDAASATLFSGDLWLGVRARVMHEDEDPYTLIESLRIVIALEPRRMFDAHRGLIPNATDALRLKIDWLSDVVGQIERHIAEGWTDRAIVKEKLGGEEPVAVFSAGEYSRRNLVRAVRRRVETASPVHRKRGVAFFG